MDISFIDRRTLQWTLGLALGFPATVLILGELIVRLKRAGKPVASSLGILRNLMVPILGLLILMTEVVGVSVDDTSVRVVKTLLWVTVLHASLALVNDVIFADSGEKSWRSRVPRLLLDLCRLILVMIGGSIILSTVWHLDLTQLITALGVGSIVLGLALQEPLGNVFAGLMLLFERPVNVGDWIDVEGNVGKVVEINWRSVHLMTRNYELVVVPNSSLNKVTFRNFARPLPRLREMIELGFSYGDPPNKVKKVIREVLLKTDGVLSDPVPTVRTSTFSDFAITYEVRFAVDSYERLFTVRDLFMTRVWYAARRHGLSIPFPTQVHLSASDLEPDPAADPAEILRTLPTLGMKDMLGMEGLSAHFRWKDFALGERIVSVGERPGGLYLMLEGSASLTARDASGHEHEIARVERGEFFGEESILSGRPIEVSVTALEDSVALELDPEGFQAILDRRPRLARELGNIMDVRHRAAQAVRRLVSNPVKASG